MLSTASTYPGAYPSTLSGFRSIINTEGIPGLYRGLVPSLFGVSHGAVQFMAYETLKNAWRNQAEKRGLTLQTKANGEVFLGNVGTLVLSGTSKIIAGSVTYPYQVVRARLQTYDAEAVYGSALDVVRKVVREEGIRGFYKG